jgi:pheromone shutdown protein TraB
VVRWTDDSIVGQVSQLVFNMFLNASQREILQVFGIALGSRFVSKV